MKKLFIIIWLFAFIDSTQVNSAAAQVKTIDTNTVESIISEETNNISHSRIAGSLDSSYFITTVIIGDSVTTIKDNAFYMRIYLTSVTIGDSVITIGNSAFAFCESLTSIIIPESVITIGGGAFQCCRGLTSVTIGSNVTIIGSMSFNHTDLTSVTIPNSVTTIGYTAFGACTNLTSVIIGNNVTSIGSAAFAGCYNLSSISIYAKNPPTLGTDVFYNVPANISVYIPYGSLNAYQTANCWKRFSNFIEIPDTTIALQKTKQYRNKRTKKSKHGTY